MSTVLLPPSDNSTAVDKHINIYLYGIPRKLVALCYKRLFSPDRNDCGYANALQLLNLHTLRERRGIKIDAIAVINIFLGL